MIYSQEVDSSQKLIDDFVKKVNENLKANHLRTQSFDE